MFDDYEPCYIISVAAEMVEVHPQTLRHYERIGLVQPKRSDGNIRLYSERDLDLVRQIRRLMDDLGVNLAGVEIILNMRERMMEMEAEIARLRRLAGEG
jgi:MerR family transcriptional regulator/heat shock protein HspR